MAHPKAVPVDLGGQTRHVLYDINALCALMDEGVDTTTLTDDLLKDPRVVRKLVWAGLLHESPDVTLHQVGEWIDFSNLMDVAQAFTKAFERAAQRRIPDPPTPRGTGTSPTSSEAATAS